MAAWILNTVPLSEVVEPLPPVSMVVPHMKPSPSGASAVRGKAPRLVAEIPAKDSTGVRAPVAACTLNTVPRLLAPPQ